MTPPDFKRIAKDVIRWHVGQAVDSWNKTEEGIERTLRAVYEQGLRDAPTHQRGTEDGR